MKRGIDSRPIRTKEMYTRYLVAVVKDEAYKIAQYGQDGGEPSSAGKAIIEFVSDPRKLNALYFGIDSVNFMNPKDPFVRQYQAAIAGTKDKRTEEQKQWLEKYIDRNLGHRILHSVAELSTNPSKYHEPVLLRNQLSFAGDSELCEWAYVIDFDKSQFEIYEGFNNQPVNEGRFRSDDKDLDHPGDTEPVILRSMYLLSELPTTKEFLTDFAEDA